MQKAYDGLSYAPGDFPVCEKAAAEIVSLPMFPQLTAEQQARVVKVVDKFVAGRPENTSGSADAGKVAVAERIA